MGGVNMLQAFGYIADKKSKVLILGSMPSVKSLEKQEYYGHPQNAFWPIIFEMFDVSPTQNFSEKKQLLLDRNIALWDVLAECEREGSSDANIRNPVANDFERFFKEHPRITTVFFNGKTAEKMYKRLVIKTQALPELEYFSLPSTSPLHTVPRKEKLHRYLKIKEKLDM